MLRVASLDPNDLFLLHLQVAYRCVQDKDFAVQTSQPPEITTERKTRKASQGEDKELTYLLEMTTVGYSRDIIS